MDEEGTERILIRDLNEEQRVDILESNESFEVLADRYQVKLKTLQAYKYYHKNRQHILDQTNARAAKKRGAPAVKTDSESAEGSNIFKVKIGNIVVNIQNQGTRVSEIITDEESLTIKVVNN